MYADQGECNEASLDTNIFPLTSFKICTDLFLADFL